jgi:hypothetical protein
MKPDRWADQYKPCRHCTAGRPSPANKQTLARREWAREPTGRESEPRKAAGAVRCGRPSPVPRRGSPSVLPPSRDAAALSCSRDLHPVLFNAPPHLGSALLVRPSPRSTRPQIAAPGRPVRRWIWTPGPSAFRIDGAGARPIGRARPPPARRHLRFAFPLRSRLTQPLPLCLPLRHRLDYSIRQRTGTICAKATRALCTQERTFVPICNGDELIADRLAVLAMMQWRCFLWPARTMTTTSTAKESSRAGRIRPWERKMMGTN